MCDNQLIQSTLSISIQDFSITLSNTSLYINDLVIQKNYQDTHLRTTLLLVSASSNLVLNKTVIRNFKFKRNLLEVHQGRLDCYDVIFQNNTKETYRNQYEPDIKSFVIKLSQPNSYFIQTIFENNKADATINSRDQDQFHLEDCSFLENKADIGSVIYAEESKDILLKNVTVQKNQAESLGSTFYFKSSNIRLIQNCTFEFNYAKGQGGVFYLPNSTIKNFTHNNCSQSSAQIFGVVFVLQNGSSIQSISHIYLANNIAGENGGAIYLHKSEIDEIQNSFFKYNVAQQNGGAIYAGFSKTKNISGNQFNYNQAK